MSMLFQICQIQQKLSLDAFDSFDLKIFSNKLIKPITPYSVIVVIKGLDKWLMGVGVHIYRADTIQRRGQEHSLVTCSRYPLVNNEEFLLVFDVNKPDFHDLDSLLVLIRLIWTVSLYFHLNPGVNKRQP